MSPVQPEPGLYTSLSRIPEALRNERALFALLVTNLLGAALIFLGYILHEPMIMVVLIVLLSLLVLPIGSSIAGLLLMDQARGQPPRSLDKAALDGIYVFPRILGVSLLSVAMTVVLCLAIGLVLLICKLPFIGSALYAVLFPALVILAGVSFFGFMAGLSITGPAIWSGASVREALFLVWRIASTRLPELLISLLLLAAFILLVECVLGAVFFVGHTFVRGASAYILGGGLEKEYLFGAMIGMALILSAMTAMSMMGLNLIFLRLTKGMDTALVQEPAPLQAPLRERSAPPPKEKMEPTIQPLPSANDRTRSTSTPPFSGASNRPAGSERKSAATLHPGPNAAPTIMLSPLSDRSPRDGGRNTPAHSAPTIMISRGIPDEPPKDIKRAPPVVPASDYERAPAVEPLRSAPPPAHSAPTVMVSKSGPDGPISSGGKEILEQFFAAQQFAAKETAPVRSFPETKYPSAPSVPNTPEKDDQPEPFTRVLDSVAPNEKTSEMIACPRCQIAAHASDCFCGSCGARLHGWS